MRAGNNIPMDLISTNNADVNENKKIFLRFGLIKYLQPVFIAIINKDIKIRSLIF